MDFRAELQERLGRVPFTAAQVARAAGLSRDWVAKARKGTAYKIGWDTAQRIHAAIDALAEQAQPRVQEPSPRPEHPGVERLALILQAAPGEAVSPEELDDLRTWQTPNGPIATPGEALDLLLARRRRRRAQPS